MDTLLQLRRCRTSPCLRRRATLRVTVRRLALYCVALWSTTYLKKFQLAYWITFDTVKGDDRPTYTVLQSKVILILSNRICNLLAWRCNHFMFVFFDQFFVRFDHFFQ